MVFKLNDFWRRQYHFLVQHFRQLTVATNTNLTIMHVSAILTTLAAALTALANPLNSRQSSSCLQCVNEIRDFNWILNRAQIDKGNIYCQ